MRTHNSLLLAPLTALLLLGAIACGEPEEDAATDMNTPDQRAQEDLGSLPEDMPTLDMPEAADMASTPDIANGVDMNNDVDMPNPVDMGTDEDMPADMPADVDMPDEIDMPAPMSDVPSNSDDIFAYLQARTYTNLPAEPAIHSSTGPHGRVRTFVNDTLATSIRANATTHPVGSASIKELYSSADALTGWAVSVKVSETNGNGNDWYWYEVFSTTQNNPVADATGAGLCTGCHGGGTDFVLTPGPFSP